MCRRDIKACQSKGKTILLSIGGATYAEGGFGSDGEARQWAKTIWAMFGPEGDRTVNRPFGSAVLDGFDLDFEAPSSNMVPFASELRSLMDAAAAGSTNKYFLSVAPQCVFPDVANNDMLQAVSFDFVSVQFYNNWCGVNGYVPGSSTQNRFNFETWDNWAKTASKNPAVKILLGVLGSPTAGGGYVSGDQLTSVIAYSRQFSSFGGVMAWDMSQVFGNPGFLDAVAAGLSGSNPIPTLTTSITSCGQAPTPSPSPSPTSSGSSNPGPGPTPTGSLVPQWGQCGGKGYTGPTECQPPFKCVVGSEWWSDCR